MTKKINAAWKEAYIHHHSEQFRTSLDHLQVPVNLFQGLFHVGLTIFALKKIYALLVQEFDIGLAVLGLFITVLGLWLLIRLNNALMSLFNLAYAKAAPGSFHRVKALPWVIDWLITALVVFAVQGLLRSDRFFF